MLLRLGELEYSGSGESGWERLRWNRFISTPIMSDVHRQMLMKAFEQAGSDWAQVEDSAKAVIRVATDSEINGE
jgi:hypothetical protein